MCVSLFNPSQISFLPTEGTLSEGHSFTTLILKSLLFFLKPHMNIFTYFRCVPSPIRWKAVRNQCCQQLLILSAHYTPWRRLQCLPWASPLVCGVNRIAEAKCLLYLKQQQESNKGGGREEGDPCGYFLVILTIRGGSPLPLQPPRGQPVKGFNAAQVVLGNNGSIQCREHLVEEKVPLLLKMVNCCFWDVGGRRGGH